MPVKLSLYCLVSLNSDSSQFQIETLFGYSDFYHYLCLQMGKEQSSIKERERTGIREPKRYKVILHNDDFTTMDFVVMILVQVFFKTEEAAEALMMQVHREGKAVAGVYTLDAAVSKVQKATQLARTYNFPLRLTYEEE